MAARAFLKTVVALVIAAPLLLGLCGTAWAQATVDVSKLKKGDKLELKVGDKWVPARFEKPNTGKVIIVRREGAAQSEIAFIEMVRLPPDGDAAKPAFKPRTWTDRTGKFKIDATLVRVEGDKVVLKRTEGGKEIAVALAKLSEADNKYVKNIAARLKRSKTARPAESVRGKNDATQPADEAEPKNAEPEGR